MQISIAVLEFQINFVNILCLNYFILSNVHVHHGFNRDGAQYYDIVNIIPCLSISQLINIWIFSFGVILNKGAKFKSSKNMLMFSFLLSTHPQMEFLDHILSAYLVVIHRQVVFQYSHTPPTEFYFLYILINTC